VEDEMTSNIPNVAKVEIIRTNGTRETRLIAKPTLLRSIKRFIGAEVTDTVNLRDGRVMICNDNGWETETIEQSPGHIVLKPVRALLPINEVATQMYWKLTRTREHRIAGDVAIAKDEDFA
jgi:hypothetical protein